MIIEIKNNILNLVCASVLKSHTLNVCFNFLYINQYEMVLSIMVNVLKILHYSLCAQFSGYQGNL
jgi:hypothetical protein